MAICEKEFEWRKWIKDIPFIQWPSDWKVKAVPPFAGAVIRYLVQTPKGEASVYLDCYDQLGCMGEPYWEVYPVEDDVERCLMNETDKLLEILSRVINNR